MGIDKIWRLYAGEEHLADLVVDGGDFPWLEAKCLAQPGLDRFRELFASELAALDAEDFERADALYLRKRELLRLTYPEGGDVPEFMLHLQDDRAWWRWHDEPFEDDE
jgi:hypothetical protein